MREICEKIEINPQQLYNGCIFMAVAHAVTVGEYPELNYEHSWDGINYCMNNSRGCRGTITFGDKYIVAVFQDVSAKAQYQDAMNYFKDAPETIIELAKKGSAAICSGRHRWGNKTLYYSGVLGNIGCAVRRHRCNQGIYGGTEY